MRIHIEQCICDHDRRELADDTEHFTIFGTTYEIDLCPSCKADFEAAVQPFVDSAREVQASGPQRAAPPLDPRATQPHVRVVQTAEGQHYEPQPVLSDIWWETPKDANPRTRRAFSDMRRQIVEWAQGQPDRFPEMANHSRGRLPTKVAYAWTREVAYGQPSAEEAEPDDTDDGQIALTA